MPQREKRLLTHSGNSPFPGELLSLISLAFRPSPGGSLFPKYCKTATRSYSASQTMLIGLSATLDFSKSSLHLGSLKYPSFARFLFPLAVDYCLYQNCILNSSSESANTTKGKMLAVCSYLNDDPISGTLISQDFFPSTAI